MSNFSLSRRIMIVLTVAAVALGGLALPATAKGGSKARGKQQTVETSTHKGKGRSTEAKARKAGLRFVAVGFITAVDTDTVQVAVKGGNKALRRMDGPVDFTVAEGAKVKRDGERVTLDVLQVGDHVMVKGAKLEDVLTVRKVLATSPDEDEDELETDTVDDGTGDDTSGTGDDTSGTGDDTSGTGDDTSGTGDDTSGTSDGSGTDGTVTV